MKRNVGSVDRVLRIIIGLALLAVGIFVAKTTLWTVILVVVGLVLLVTGLNKFCLLYLPFHINTGKAEDKKA